MMRIFAGGIATETNTFAPVPTGIDDFFVQRGCDSVAAIAHSSLDLARIWGRQSRAHGAQLIVGLHASAEPSGVTCRSAYESLRDELLENLRAALPVDVVLLMLHGAMVADGYEDCEEDILRRVRHLVGPDVAIGVELDLHCHLTAAKITAADVVVTYKEYPHEDIEERAAEVFELAVATKLGRIRPTIALFDCRMVGFYPTSRQPLRQFVEDMMSEERRNGVLSLSFAHGFPFADLPYVGAKMLVITDGDPELAQHLAAKFGKRAHDLRAGIGFDSISLTMEQALVKAVSSDATPVVVADQSDNPGAGAPGDATFALRWLIEHGAQDVAMAIFHDPEVVKIAGKAGVGAQLPVRLGGKTGPFSGEPLDLQITVTSVRAGYMHAWPQRSGEPLLCPVGDVAALRCGGIDIVVGSKRCQCYCPSIFSDLGVDPSRKRLLVVKSTQHFHLGFAAMAADVIYMAAPGAVAPDPRRIPYRRLNTAGLYPWNPMPFAS